MLGNVTVKMGVITVDLEMKMASSTSSATDMDVVEKS